MKDDLLFNLSMDHWPAVLLSFIPALLNFSIIIYSLIFLRRSPLIIPFLSFVSALFVWQMSDTLVRMSVSEETAKAWWQLLSFGAVFITPAGLYFTLQFINRKRWKRSIALPTLLFLPSLIIAVLNTSGKGMQEVYASDFWGWNQGEANTLGIIGSFWVAGLAFVILFVLISFAYRIKNENRKKYIQTLLIAGGFALPTISGTIAQVVFPVFFRKEAIPLASSIMLAFSVCTFIALTKYRFLSYSPRYQWNKIIDAMNEGVLIVDNEDNIMYANKGLCEMVGYNYQEIKGKVAKELFLEIAGQSYLESILLERKNKISGNYELPFKTKPGKRIWVMTSGSPYLDENGTVIGSIGILTNITKRKNLEEDLKEKVKELEALVYHCSHDLRGPLTSILGLTNLGKREVKDEYADVYFDKITTSITRLDNILIELSNLAYITQAKIEPRQVDLKKEVYGILESLKHLPNYSKIEFTTEINLSYLFCDNIMLILILQNILINSINYLDEKKETHFVHIKAYENTNNMKIEISDNGIGIDKEVQQKVFDLFYRGTDISTGSGLGLYIVKNGITKLNGFVNFESEKGAGTTFAITLPKK